MKVNVDCNNCEITIEEVDGKCIVTAIQGGEVVEEFTVNCEEESLEDDSVEELPEGEEDLDNVDVVEGEEDLLEDEEIVEGVKTFTQFYVGKKK